MLVDCRFDVITDKGTLDAVGLMQDAQVNRYMTTHHLTQQQYTETVHRCTAHCGFIVTNQLLHLCCRAKYQQSVWSLLNPDGLLVNLLNTASVSLHVVTHWCCSSNRHPAT